MHVVTVLLKLYYLSSNILQCKTIWTLSEQESLPTFWGKYNMHSTWKPIWVHIQPEILHFTSLAVLDRVGVSVLLGFFLHKSRISCRRWFIERCYLKEWQKTRFITNLTKIYTRNVSNSPVHWKKQKSIINYHFLLLFFPTLWFSLAAVLNMGLNLLSSSCLSQKQRSWLLKKQSEAC